MPVDYVREDVLAMVPAWDRIGDCLKGSDAVKAKGADYLVKPNSADTSPANAARFMARLKRAVFYNVTRRTHAGLTGQVFSKDPSVELPPLLAPMELDVDGSGLPLDQLAKRTLGEIIAKGRAGLLVDYPRTEGATTRQDALDGSVHPVIVFYSPKSIINWRAEAVGSRQVVSLVVLSETYVDADDGFEIEFKPQCRELRLVDGVATVSIWRKDHDGTWDIVEGPEVVQGSDGTPLQELPFIFVGAERNGPEINDPPMLDIADLNLSHYNSSADYEDSAYLIGQPMYVFTGLTQHWVDDVLGGTIQIGSAAGLPLPVGASADVLQPDPNTMAKDAMMAKEEQMRALGAKLVEPRTGQKTAAEVVLEEASESSILTTAAKNTATAITEALRFAALFAGEASTDDNSLAYELNTDFTASRLSSQERQQLIAEWQGGAITWHEYRWNLRRAGLVYEDDDKARTIIEEELPPTDDTGPTL